jgi:hypothetical protein
MPEVSRQQRQLVSDIKASPVPAQQCVYGEAVPKIMNSRQLSFCRDNAAFLEQRPKRPYLAIHRSFDRTSSAVRLHVLLHGFPRFTGSFNDLRLLHRCSASRVCDKTSLTLRP